MNSNSSINTAPAHNRSYYSGLNIDTYEDGAPHLKHQSIRALYDRVICETVADCKDKKVLDLGAGNGQITKHFLSRGAYVTAIDISEQQLRLLVSHCADAKDRLNVQCGDASLCVAQSNQSWDIIIANSFLHHVPDYSTLLMNAIQKLAIGGVLITFQDPMRYDALPWATRLYSAGAYLCWRIRQGQVVSGFARRIRRNCGQYDPNSVHDNTEYHVVRNGVDHIALENMLLNFDMNVRIIRYFSTQSPWCQTIGEKLGMTNYFAVVATKS
jgi:2-polyprenyl-3-methyl-5-hydroxy-6-metoxy-1,4-benzoquinol methylase